MIHFFDVGPLGVPGHYHPTVVPNGTAGRGWSGGFNAGYWGHSLAASLHGGRFPGPGVPSHLPTRAGAFRGMRGAMIHFFDACFTGVPGQHRGHCAEQGINFVTAVPMAPIQSASNRLLGTVTNNCSIAVRSFIVGRDTDSDYAGSGLGGDRTPSGLSCP